MRKRDILLYFISAIAGVNTGIYILQSYKLVSLDPVTRIFFIAIAIYNFVVGFGAVAILLKK